MDTLEEIQFAKQMVDMQVMEIADRAATSGTTVQKIMDQDGHYPMVTLLSAKANLILAEQIAKMSD